MADYTSISAKNDDYSFYEEIKAKWVKQNIANISMSQLIKIAMVELNEKLGK